MANTSTKLYASQANGGRADVTIAQIGALVGGATVPAASTTTAGIVKQSADVAALSSIGPGTPAAGIVDVTATFSQPIVNANFATLATQVNAILTALKNAGIMA
jgi:hypothetical protein